MLSAAIMLFLQSIYFTLRVSGPGTSFPKPLSEQEERECLERYANGDNAAKNKLIEHNLRLVAHIVKKYYASSMDTDDLISIGTIGLIKAISSFNASRGARLATYAARCVENEILMHFRTLRRQVSETSLSEPLDSDSEGNDLSFIDIISTDDCILDKIDEEDTRTRLNAIIEKKLNKRERMIIRKRYGLDDNVPVTQREIANACGISRSYVSRIEKKALEKLREEFEND